MFFFSDWKIINFFKFLDFFSSFLFYFSWISYNFIYFFKINKETSANPSTYWAVLFKPTGEEAQLNWNNLDPTIKAWLGFGLRVVKISPTSTHLLVVLSLQELGQARMRPI